MLNTDLIQTNELGDYFALRTNALRRNHINRVKVFPKPVIKDVPKTTELVREEREIRLNPEFLHAARRRFDGVFAPPPVPVAPVEPTLVWDADTKDTLEIAGWRPPLMKEIARRIRALHHVTTEELMGIRRERRITRARQHYYYLCKKHTDKSFPEIGRSVKKDHTTVLHGVKVIENLKARAHSPGARAERIRKRQEKSKNAQR